MPKQCGECGTIMNDAAPRCDSCGASSWKILPTRQIVPRVWKWLSLLVVLGLIVYLYLTVVARVPQK